MLGSCFEKMFFSAMSLQSRMCAVMKRDVLVAKMNQQAQHAHELGG
jgi:hypothetical protein